MIQYCRMGVGLPDENTWRMTVSESNACLGARSLGMVGLARSAIVPAGASREEEPGQRCGGVREPSALAPAYQGNNL